MECNNTNRVFINRLGRTVSEGVLLLYVCRVENAICSTRPVQQSNTKHPLIRTACSIMSRAGPNMTNTVGPAHGKQVHACINAHGQCPGVNVVCDTDVGVCLRKIFRTSKTRTMSSVPEENDAAGLPNV